MLFWKNRLVGKSNGMGQALLRKEQHYQTLSAVFEKGLAKINEILKKIIGAIRFYFPNQPLRQKYTIKPRKINIITPRAAKYP